MRVCRKEIDHNKVWGGGGMDRYKPVDSNFIESKDIPFTFHIPTCLFSVCEKEKKVV